LPSLAISIVILASNAVAIEKPVPITTPARGAPFSGKNHIENTPIAMLRKVISREMVECFIYYPFLYLSKYYGVGLTFMN